MCIKLSYEAHYHLLLAQVALNADICFGDVARLGHDMHCHYVFVLQPEAKNTD